MVVKSFTYQGFDGLADYTVEVPKEAAVTEAQQAEASAPVFEAPKPQFTAEELEMAKALAREEGLNAGREAARKEFEDRAAAAEADERAKSVELLEKINFQIGVLNFKSQETKSKLSDKITKIALQIAKKVCGEVSDKVIEAEISTVLKEAVQKMDADEKIKIYTSAQNAAHLNNKFTGAAINIDNDMQPGDFRIEWKNGFAKRDVKKLWESISELCGRHSSLEENEEQEK